MRSWRLRAEPAPCPGLGWGVVGLYALAFALPWLAGVPAVTAVVLSLFGLAGMRAAARTIPGRRAGLRCLEHGPQGWSAVLGDGREVPVRILPATRVLPRVVFCRLAIDGRRVGWTVPAYAMPAAEFRRLKVALRGSAGLHGTA